MLLVLVLLLVVVVCVWVLVLVRRRLEAGVLGRVLQLPIRLVPEELAR